MESILYTLYNHISRVVEIRLWYSVDSFYLLLGKPIRVISNRILRQVANIRASNGTDDINDINDISSNNVIFECS